ncbi:alkylated DNA repair protein alkB homolog 8 [Bactrocera neohumeralis]|uniref:alkylated DNA repair protein alkB homolog 8 n=1 Tax=Bactrocera neohumeralis TaxID=98809 RepID=UPI00216538EE|nr:alkylated DNA repair protein alkB homolog 8 [Bactrocera neohumeralis]
MTKDYSSRKLERKQRRCEAIIRTDVGIESSEKPTCFLGILNAGLSTGLTEESVLSNAIQYAPVQQVVMLPNKSYCFLKCDNVNNAERIYNNMHGRAGLEQRGGVVYLSYFKSLPMCKEENVWAKPLPEGLVLLPDFLTESEENMLLKAINIEDVEQSDLKHRRVKHFGYQFIYGENNVDPTKPLNDKIPNECDMLWPRLKAETTKLGLPTWDWDMPDQLTVNIYEPGQGIPPHVDTHSAFLDPIFSLSLLGDVVMDFRRGSDRQPLKLLRRSMLVMSGTSRYDWTHGITPRTLDIVPSETGLTVMPRQKRISLTFRRLRRGPCDCTFPTLCDSHINAQSNLAPVITDVIAAQLEEKNVHSVYDRIAPHFSETRHTPWPRVAEFLRSFQTGSVLLDIGCGNGKYLQCNNNALTIGCDRSSGLINACLERAKIISEDSSNLPNAFRCDCLHVPVRSQTVDGCISIAVIHHLATADRRLAAIREMARLLRPGGRALIYVWAKDQRANDNKKSAYLLQNKALNKNKTTVEQQRQCAAEEVQQQQAEQFEPFITGAPQLPVHTNRTDFMQQDVLVPWKLKGASVANKDMNNSAPSSTYLRYYHVFEYGELEAMLAQVSDVELVQSYYDQGNHCVIFERRQK